MPIDYNNYPSNWKSEIRPAILKRANNCCELCGVRNGAIGVRDNDHIRKFTEIGDDEAQLFWAEMTGFKVIKIVLTIAHKCNNSMCSNHDHLLALCQKCHLGLDKELHSSSRRTNKAKSMGLQDLFEYAPKSRECPISSHNKSCNQ